MLVVTIYRVYRYAQTRVFLYKFKIVNKQFKIVNKRLTFSKISQGFNAFHSRFFTKVIYSRCAPMFGKYRFLRKKDKNSTVRYVTNRRLGGGQSPHRTSKIYEFQGVFWPQWVLNPPEKKKNLSPP